MSVATLGYIEKGQRIDVSIVGDPTTIGPNTNSCDSIMVNLPEILIGELNQSKSNDPKLTRAILAASGSKSSPLNVVVPSGFAFVTAKPRAGIIINHTEMMARYQNESNRSFFLEIDQSDVYCDVCFIKKTSLTDEIVMCDHNTEAGAACLQGRHRLCFEAPVSISAIASMTHLCQLHRIESAPQQSSLRSYAPSSPLVLAPSYIPSLRPRVIYSPLILAPSSKLPSSSSVIQSESSSKLLQSRSYVRRQLDLTVDGAVPPQSHHLITIEASINDDDPAVMTDELANEQKDDVAIDAAPDQEFIDWYNADVPSDAEADEWEIDADADDDQPMCSDDDQSDYEPDDDAVMKTSSLLGHKRVRVDASSDDIPADDESASVASVSAGAGPLRSASVGSGFVVKLRDWDRTIKSGAFSMINASANDDATLRKMVFDDAARYKRQGRRQQEIDNFDVESLMKNYSEVKSCCGVPAFMIGAQASHPFSSPVSMLERRIQRCNTPSTLKDYTATHLMNQSISPNGDNRQVMLDGRRCCQSCFLASTGSSSRSFRRTNSDLSKGYGSIGQDLRSVVSGRRNNLVQLLVHNIMLMIDMGMGQTLPTSDGGHKYQSIHMPFTTQKAFSTQIVLFMMQFSGVDDRPLNAEEYEKACIVITPNSLRRAIQELRNKHHIAISITKVVKFMRCTSCSRFDNERKELNKTANNAHLVQALSLRRRAHIDQVVFERAQFDIVKKIAK